MAEGASKSACDAIAGFAIANEPWSRAFLEPRTGRVTCEELTALVEGLRKEEGDHLARLQALLQGLEVDRPGDFAVSRTATGEWSSRTYRTG